MALPTAVVAGVAASVAALVLLAVAAALCWWRLGARRSRTSDTASDETPPTLAEWGRCGRTSSAPDYQGARRFTLEEMCHATKNFSDANLVGAGTFGKVYMGLLLDGTVVAIKRRVGAPRQDFVDEVRRQSEIWHRNVVTLIGYCQDGGLQMLVFEHLPNGSVCGHLYDTGKESMTRLEFKQRLSIAIGAAKGLDHLHSLAPPLIHKGFKTSNVLVDENFIAKVSDAGVDRLLRGLEDPGSPLNGFRSGIYQDPEAHSLAQLSASSDVYSFGVFLLELITGREAASLVSPESTESLAHWLEASGDEVADPRLGGSFTSEGMKELVGLTLQCLSPSAVRRRPRMRLVAAELDRILEKEMTLTTVMGDGTAIITLGSQLFTS
ncbi:hypothetical protein ACQJBY_025077 [Aegilops geniculata]